MRAAEGLGVARRNALVDAYESSDKDGAIESLKQVLAQRDRAEFKETVVREYFRMADTYMQTVQTIDLGRRETYAASLQEVKDALVALFGPFPGDDVPTLAEDKYGATRWDLLQRDLNKLLYAEQWDGVSIPSVDGR